jgi:predicted nucleic acid-binding protein
MEIKNIFPKKIYLDTSVFIAEFDKKDPRHKLLTSFLKNIEKIEGVELCYSKWALTEMYNRLTKNQIEELKIIKYINQLLSKNKIRCQNLRFLEVNSNKNYTFNDFFAHLEKDLVKYKTGKDRPGLGDIIHIRIMKNNKINTILTFDSHFDEIEGITSINLSKIESEKKDETANTK